MLASEIGNVSIAQRLITAGTDINAQDYSGRTAFHLAAMHGQEDIMWLLTENKLENLEGSGIDVEEAPIKCRYYILDCSSCTYQVETLVSLESLLRLTRCENGNYKKNACIGIKITGPSTLSGSTNNIPVTLNRQNHKHRKN